MDLGGAKYYIVERLRTELAENLYYHSVDHTLDVHQATRWLIEQEQVPEQDHKLLETAALYHDAGFLEQYTHNEAVGARIAREALPSFDYTSEDIDRVETLILSTRYDIAPTNYLEEILSDADTEYLGRDDCPEIASLLIRELREYGFDHDDDEWRAMQIRFLEKHQYYTNTALVHRQAGKLDYLDSVRATVI